MYHAQVHPQHQVAKRVAVDPQVLPGHEVHVDLAPLVFISKGRRDNLLEDTKAHDELQARYTVAPLFRERATRWPC